MSVAEDPAYTYQWRDEYGIIDGKNTGYYTASESGIYSLIISNATGCSVETVPLSVTVKPMPIKPILQTDNYTPGSCLGLDPVIIFTDEVAGYSYQWLRNGLPMAGETGSSIEGYLSEGDYSLIADLNGCTVESDIQTLDFENAPKKPDLYVKGPVVWYMAASNDTASAYIWYLNNQVIPGAEDYIYVANQTLGKYSVAVANEFGCLTISDELTIPVSKSEMTNFLVPDEYSIDGLDPFSNLRIYPNPTPGLFTVEMDNHIMGELDINIFTNEGRQILNIKFEKTTVHFQSQIDLSGQGNGIYLINLLLEQYAANRKIVVE